MQNQSNGHMEIWMKDQTADIILYHTIRLLTTLKKKPFENIVGKGENADNQHFLLLPQHLLPIPKGISVCKSRLFCNLQMLSILTGQKSYCLVKG